LSAGADPDPAIPPKGLKAIAQSRTQQLRGNADNSKCRLLIREPLLSEVADVVIKTM
jgi:hypothetical protein